MSHGKTLLLGILIEPFVSLQINVIHLLYISESVWDIVFKSVLSLTYQTNYIGGQNEPSQCTYLNGAVVKKISDLVSV